VDSFTQETLLKAECDTNDVDVISYHLYDSSGDLVAESDGEPALPEGVQVLTGAGEELLYVPSGRDESVRYRLYSMKGALLTCSDGRRTLIYGGVHIEGNKHLPGRPPAAHATTAASDAIAQQSEIQE
jgi:hypothetical protein